MTKKTISFILTFIFVITSVGAINSFADDDFVTWTKITDMQFTKSDYDNGVFGFPKSFTSTIRESFPDGEGYKVINPKGTQEVMNINVAPHGYEDKTLKYSAGIRWKTNREGDSAVFSLFINDANGAFAGAIRVLGNQICFANSTSYSGVYVSVPTDQTDYVEASLIFDPTAMTATPAINGVPIGVVGTFDGKISYSGGIPSSFSLSLWLNWSSSDYVQFTNLFIESGYDPTLECDYSTLTNEEPEKITQDLNLMTSLENGAEISWESDNESVISAAGTVTRQDNDEVVNLTASINYDNKEFKKKFKFIVLAENKLENNFILEEANFNTDAPYYNLVSEGGFAGIKDRRLVLEKNNQLEVSAEKFFVSNLSEKPYSVKAQRIIFEQYLSASGAFDSIFCDVRNDEDNVIATYGFEKTGINELEFFCSHKDGESRISYISDKEIYVKLEVNSIDNTMKIYVNNTELDPEIVKNTKASAGISSVKYYIEGMGGRLTADNLSLMINEANQEKAKVVLDAANVRVADMTNQNAQMITGNLVFAEEARFGSKLSYTSSDTSVIDQMGFVKRAETDKNVVITVSVKNGNEEIQKTFDFVVKKTDNMNLAVGKSVTASGYISGFDASNAVDWLKDTQWRTNDETKSITVNLGEDKLFNSVYLDEAIPYNISEFKIDISENGRSWKNVYAGTEVGEEKTCKFDIVNCRYIRFTASSSSSDTIGLKELGVYYKPDPEKAAELDFETVQILGDYTVSGDLTLIGEGIYGSKITWSSSKPEIISNDGKLLRRPSTDTIVTITATITNENVTKTKDFKRYVEGTEKESSSSGGGGGGRSSGIKSPGIIGTANSGNTGADDKTEQADARFSDVSENRWSYEYIKELKAAGIISGSDGLFRPEANVTREEFVKMLVLSLGIEASGICTFEDVESGAWYEKYIAAAVGNNLVNGISDKIFGIGSYISRQDMAVMISRAVSDRELSEDNDFLFKDESEISDYAKEAVTRLAKAGILSGDNGRFSANGNLTREQAAKVLCSLRKELVK